MARAAVYPAIVALAGQGRAGTVKDDDRTRFCRLQQCPAGHGAVTEIQRFYALDDCGTRINPMIIEGEVHGGLTEALAIAMGQEMAHDEAGNLTNASLLDFYLPTAVETPSWETDFTTTPSPHHPIGTKGVGESPNVGGVSAFSNAVNDAFAHLGLTHTQMRHDRWRVWKIAQSLGLPVA